MNALTVAVWRFFARRNLSTASFTLALIPG
jgi:hypothetical protein